jgi:hypothetical protein
VAEYDATVSHGGSSPENRLCGGVVAIGAVIATLSYAPSTAIAVIITSAPFQAPLSHWIYFFPRLMFASVTEFLHIPAWFQDRRSIYIEGEI